MDTLLTMSRNRARTPLAALGKLTVVGLIGIGLGLIYLQAAMIGMIIPPLAVFTVLRLWLPALWQSAGAGRRCSARSGACLSLLGIARRSPIAWATRPRCAGLPLRCLSLAVAAIGLVAGIGATVQNYRSSERRTPRALPLGLTLLVGLLIGALTVASIAAGGVNAGVSPEMLASLTAFTTANFAFDQQEIRVQAGETIALRLENGDSEGHSFDIDQFGVHTPMPSGEASLALFKPTQPGTYTFYCAPHYSKETGEGMKGTLIVE